MDERTIKRLLIILAASILAVVLIKVALIKTYTTLNKAAAEKKQPAPVNSTATQQETTSPAVLEKIGTPVASGVGDTTEVVSPASSSVGETH
ncbi:MAG: hypothetical protein HY935_00890 [Nitrosomonadales bacterium]|nr:hypothetical protein [Nitrosomonadales bacterium]